MRSSSALPFAVFASSYLPTSALTDREADKRDTAGIIDLVLADASVISNASIPAEETRRSAEQRTSSLLRPYLDKAESLYEYELFVSGRVVTSTSQL